MDQHLPQATERLCKRTQPTPKKTPYSRKPFPFPSLAEWDTTVPPGLHASTVAHACMGRRLAAAAPPEPRQRNWRPHNRHLPD